MTSPPQYPGQPFQPPSQGQPLQPPSQWQPLPGQPPPYDRPEQPPTQPQGPPANATPGRAALWPVAFVVLVMVVIGVSYWMGTYLGIYGNRGITFYLLIAAVAVAVGALMAVWSETAFEVRTWGSDLFGKTALGWRRVDLAGLSSAAIASGRGANTIMLGDSQGRIAFSDKKLGPIVDGVRRGLVEAAQQGRLVVPAQLAQLLGLPVAPGASKSGKSGVTPKLLTVLALIAIGIVIGVVAVS